MKEIFLPFEKEKREVLAKRNVDTSKEYGCKPEDRKTEEILEYGIVNLDKPPGPTSHQATAYLKDAIHSKKAGHSGTLE
jgi:H/ACA ribonucleoprotein complex subunit 4